VIPPLSSPTLPSLPCTRPLDTEHVISILSWNINGSFALLLSCPKNRKSFQNYDINLFQETHLSPQMHNAIDVPEGYTLLSRTRRPNASFAKSWGGVAVLIWSAIPFKYRQDLSGPDFMVIQINNHLIYNVYLLPESTQWAGIREKDPCEALAASIALVFSADFEISVHGNFGR
jgi:exonuclease III